MRNRYDGFREMPRMHQTTVRFGPDLWADLEREAAGVGVSIAQYVRDAAAARVNYSAGRRGDEGLARELEKVELERRTGEPAAAQRRARVRMDDANALMAEGAQVRRRSVQLRTDARRRLEELRAVAGLQRNDPAQGG